MPGEEVLAGGLALYAAKGLLDKLLGPTAEYLGEGLRNITQKRAENAVRIFEIAKARLGGKIEQPGSVPPRVLMKVLTDGSACDDELMAEYFGGVLASSRTPSGRDDRGAMYLALVGRLSVYQVRAHYLAYSAMAALYRGHDVSVATMQKRQRMGTYIPLDEFLRGMDFAPDEQLAIVTPHILAGLASEGLIEHDWGLGIGEELKKMFPGVTGDGIVFYPTVLGAELFLAAHGLGSEVSPEDFLTVESEKLRTNVSIPVPTGAVALSLKP